jgi:hypothetical protein
MLLYFFILSTSEVTSVLDGNTLSDAAFFTNSGRSNLGASVLVSFICWSIDSISFNQPAAAFCTINKYKQNTPTVTIIATNVYIKIVGHTLVSSVLPIVFSTEKNEYSFICDPPIRRVCYT